MNAKRFFGAGPSAGTAPDRGGEPVAGEHLATIDILRGIAAMSVCLYHLTRRNLMTFNDPVASWLFAWGAAGVDIFFVISGFIIPYTMMSSSYRLADFGAFFGRRFVRLVPPSWVQIASILLLFVVVRAAYGSGPAWLGELTTSRLLHNLAYTVPFTDEAWINPVFWTLAVEFQFYILVGLAFPWVFAGKREFLATCLLLIVLRHVPFIGGLLFLKHSTLFLIGGAALLHRRKVLTNRDYALLLAGLTFATAVQPGPLQAGFGCATALIISFVPLRSALGAFFGRISYSLYLTHSLTAGLTATVLIRIIPPSGAGAKLLIIGVAVLMAILTSWMFYRIVERPFIGLAKRSFPRPRGKPQGSVKIAI